MIKTKIYQTTTFWVCIVLLGFQACTTKYPEGTFGHDVELLKNVEGIQILKSGESQVAVWGKLHGRILTSTSKGLSGTSYGWFKRDIVANGTYKNRYSAVGGEDRIWFGPEGGEYSVFFKPNTERIPENIFKSPDLDTLDFKLIRQTESSVTYENEMSVTNYQGFTFNVNIERQLSIFSQDQIRNNLNIELPTNVSVVGFEARTTMTNIGKSDWKKDSGLICIWDIGCNAPSKKAIVMIPVRGDLKSVTKYFNSIDSTRVRMIDGVVYDKVDSEYLNKIGIPASNAKNTFGSYNPDLNELTIVQFQFNNDPLYVNSVWEEQTDPYAGDAINVFNDGVTQTAGPFGPFYELETSSSAKELKPQESHHHFQATYHFEGDRNQLNILSKKLLNVDLDKLETIFAN